jgi:transposase-like protein
MLEYKPCPKCSSSQVEKVGFTWWGGMLGPRLLTHVKCKDCGTAFNGKTGGSNTGAIITNNVVIGVIVIAAIFLIFSA